MFSYFRINISIQNYRLNKNTGMVSDNLGGFDKVSELEIGDGCNKEVV
jgi:hypothetical protein